MGRKKKRIRLLKKKADMAKGRNNERVEPPVPEALQQQVAPVPVPVATPKPVRKPRTVTKKVTTRKKASKKEE